MPDRVINLIEEANKKLSIIIALLANPTDRNRDKLSLREQVRLLNQYGLKPGEIATALNRTLNHISKELTLLRKEKQ